MNKVLLDTHVFIWWLNNDKKLSPELKQLLTDADKIILLSVATIWEMIIKKSAGKLRHPANLPEAIDASGFTVLPIKLDHVLELRNLPLFHKDPFDRILIAQARVEKLSLVTTDAKIAKYSVQILRG